MREDKPKTLAEKVDPRRSALIVIDIQNDFCANGGYLTKLGIDVTPVQEMVGRLERFIEAAREVKLPIIFVKVSNDPQHMSPAWLAARAWLGRDQEKPIDHMSCASGTWGADFYRVQPLPGDVVVQKHRYSAFIETDLNLILRSMGISTVIISGVATNVCVESTARDACQYDNYVVFLEDCTAASSRNLHEVTLENIRRYFGVVVSSQDVIAVWEESGVRAPVPGSSEQKLHASI